MNKRSILGASAVVAAGATATLVFGAGTAAAAPDVVGATYGDAASAISDSGGTPKIAVTVGSKLSQDDCIVTNAWNAPTFEHTGGVVMVSLNCDGDHATATNPGASVASPLGREAKAAADEASAAEESAIEQVSTPDE
ncbi:hypothetical protein [Mycolicibacterium smegmatis]|uniref:Uncharacterized protein n=3 Tax=Mycolicibacterium smegmatis TaxID=1772 RepID=A0R4B2_MYCS2|nr:hypothetical protein [Mycolicibacterium smegmatis]ABK72390.1 hypothetical protein MSMEG_5771 [Mycolicibacterium smegmatis MC2 155]AIU10781.1 hypothetical protein LJ00_28540 [Mycolicibacterium smegmatis MC2 155]AIU17406.1 hypothetical protein LI99_28545 [Mycolicibacterium smegmatis]AIU24029.1 hypothetical protein LI98_28550 [Mycolicibacterium smegmatis]AWT56611.1 hypothetical protein D806_056690 [Mycolicibacterium smegmatis MKD8]